MFSNPKKKSFSIIALHFQGPTSHIDLSLFQKIKKSVWVFGFKWVFHTKQKKGVVPKCMGNAGKTKKIFFFFCSWVGKGKAREEEEKKKKRRKSLEEVFFYYLEFFVGGFQKKK